jgi:hypothetical protein
MINKALLAEVLNRLSLKYEEMPLEEGETFTTLRAEFASFSLWFFLDNNQSDLTVHSLFRWNKEFGEKSEKFVSILNALNFESLSGGHLETSIDRTIWRYVTVRHDTGQLDVDSTQRQIAFQIMSSGLVAQVLGRFSEFPDSPTAAAAAAAEAFRADFKAFVESSSHESRQG